MSTAFQPVDGCIFCPDNGKVEILHKTEQAYVILVKGSPIDGCFFIIPKQHCTDFLGLPNDFIRDAKVLLLMLFGSSTAPQIWRPDMSLNVNLNLGRLAGQRTEHLHWWFVPREGEDPDSEAYELGLASLLAKLR